MERNAYTYKDPHGVDDMFEAIMCNGGVNFRIDEPWAGDTESGFGREASLFVPIDEAIKLARLILETYAPTGEER